MWALPLRRFQAARRGPMGFSQIPQGPRLCCPWAGFSLQGPEGIELWGGFLGKFCWKSPGRRPRGTPDWALPLPVAALRGLARQRGLFSFPLPPRPRPPPPLPTQRNGGALDVWRGRTLRSCKNPCSLQRGAASLLLQDPKGLAVSTHQLTLPGPQRWAPASPPHL